MSRLHRISGCDKPQRGADVVFVHGMGGDAFGTWRSSDPSSFWPHWLGTEFADIAIWSVGYAASPSKWLRLLRFFSVKHRNSGHSMALPHRGRQILDLLAQEGLGQRPLMFVCHSLGGLVVKQILRTSADAGDPSRHRIFQSTRGVLFLATPHAGSPLATLVDRFRIAFARTVTIEDLRAHDAHLQELFDWYRNKSTHIQTRTYFETRPIKGIVLVVDATSAHPGVGSDPVPLDEDHLSIAKPRSPKDQVYLAAAMMLRERILTVPMDGPAVAAAPSPSSAPTHAIAPGTGERDLPTSSRPGLSSRTRLAMDGTLTIAQEHGNSVSKRMERVFVSYRRGTDPDDRLASHFADELERRGHRVFINKRIAIGSEYASVIEHELAEATALIVLLSEASVASEMVIQEVTTAHERRRREGAPLLLPIRVRYLGALPYDLGAMLNRLKCDVWEKDGDERLILDRLPLEQHRSAGELTNLTDSELSPAALSADGLGIGARGSLSVPLPAFDSSRLAYLEPPGGAVRLDSPFYIERDVDRLTRQALALDGQTLLLKGSRQVGKTSLLARLYQYTRDRGQRAIFVDCQRFDKETLGSLDRLLHHLAYLIAEALATSPPTWAGPLGPMDKLTTFVAREVLAGSAEPFVLFLDEVDRLFACGFRNEFFGLLRSWHDQRAYDRPWRRVGLTLGYSTEAVLFIEDLNGSPFNVGTPFALDDFDEAQAQTLNERHGSPLVRAEVSQLMSLLSGHPFLLRRSYYELVRASSGLSSLLERACEDDGPFADHLHRCFVGVARRPELWNALATVLREGRCPSDDVFYRLRAAGLVRGHSAQRVTPRCELYRRYFATRL